MWFRRRTPSIEDNDFSFYVGRLTMAAEITSRWLLAQDDPTGKELGRSLGAVADWFVPGETAGPTTVGVAWEPVGPEADTAIRPPKKPG